MKKKSRKTPLKDKRTLKHERAASSITKEKIGRGGGQLETRASSDMNVVYSVFSPEQVGQVLVGIQSNYVFPKSYNVCCNIRRPSDDKCLVISQIGE